MMINANNLFFFLNTQIGLTRAAFSIPDQTVIVEYDTGIGAN